MFDTLSFYQTDNCAFAFDVDTLVPQTVDSEVLWDVADRFSSSLKTSADDKSDHKSQPAVLVRTTLDHPPLPVAA